MTDLLDDLRTVSRTGGDTYSSYEVIAMVRQAADEIEQLRAALKDVFALVDEGWLVRNTSEDHKPSFAMRQLSFVQRLAKAHAALAPKQPVVT